VHKSEAATKAAEIVLRGEAQGAFGAALISKGIANLLNEYRKTVVVVPLTHGSREAPPVIITIASGGENSKVVCDQIVAVDKQGRRRSAPSPRTSWPI